MTRGTYGYYSVRSNAVDPKQGFITEGNIHTNNIGLFVQDAWTINNRLTVNVGVRTERERVPTYTTGSGHPGVRHRVRLRRQAGAARRLRLRPQGRRPWKVVRLVGLFYDIFKLELPRGSFGGDKWLEYYYTLDTSDWHDAGRRPELPAGLPGHARSTRHPIDRLPSPLVRIGRDRSGPEADAAAGSDRSASTTS